MNIDLTCGDPPNCMTSPLNNGAIAEQVKDYILSNMTDEERFKATGVLPKPVQEQIADFLLSRYEIE